MVKLGISLAASSLTRTSRPNTIPYYDTLMDLSSTVALTPVLQSLFLETETYLRIEHSGYNAKGSPARQVLVSERPSWVVKALGSMSRLLSLPQWINSKPPTSEHGYVISRLLPAKRRRRSAITASAKLMFYAFPAKPMMATFVS